MGKLLIQNGRIMDPVRQIETVSDLLIEDGKIASIGSVFDLTDVEQIIDASGMIAAPGLADVHVHFRDPGLTYKEDIHTGAAAAARGGFTTVVTMANTKPPVDSVETVQYVLAEGKKTGIRVLPAACISAGMKGKELVDMEALAEAGAVGFTDDGIPLCDEKLVIEAMKRAKALNMPLSFHEEDPAFILSPGVNQGRISALLGIGGAPASAEYVLTSRDCALALATGARISIQHISAKESVSIVELFQQLGAEVYAEATPHHFTLTEDAVLAHGTLAKMNPPLRTDADRTAIIKGLQTDTISIIATDHAPHSTEEKEREFTKAPSGIIGLETSLALGITTLVRPGHMSLMELLKKMSYNPLQFYHLDGGTLKEGERADLVLFCPDEKWVPDSYCSKASNSPFTGMTLYGKVKYTICQGNVVYCDQK